MNGFSWKKCNFERVLVFVLLVYALGYDAISSFGS